MKIKKRMTKKKMIKKMIELNKVTNRDKRMENRWNNGQTDTKVSSKKVQDVVLFSLRSERVSAQLIENCRALFCQTSNMDDDEENSLCFCEYKTTVKINLCHYQMPPSPSSIPTLVMQMLTYSSQT